MDNKFAAFSAYRTTSQYLSSGDKVKFDKTWTNNNGYYDPNTGVFTAPWEGNYHFSVVSMSVENKDLFLLLYQNNVKKAGSYVRGDGYKTGTMDVVLHLSKGDTIYVSSGTSQTINSNDNNYSTFSGYFISQ